MKLGLKTPVSIDTFTHDSSKKCFTAEASDIGDAQLFQRIYDDACDLGFLVCNPDTNQSILVTLAHEHTDEEGEIESWVFLPDDVALKAHPKLKNYKFLIYND